MSNSCQIDSPAVLLVGGLGTRLQHLTADRPKALVPVAGHPFIEWQVRALQAAGFRRIHLAAGHLAEKLEQWADSFSRGEKLKITVRAEPSPLGTGGGLQFAARDLPGDWLLVVNGDTLLPNLDLPAFIAASMESGQPASMVVVPSPDAARFGTVLLQDNGRVGAFLEKGTGGPGWINGGFYLLDRVALMAERREPPWSLETDWFPALASSGQLVGIRTAPPLLDMGTTEGLAQMESHLREKS